jgi:putative oxidoreductase
VNRLRDLGLLVLRTGVGGVLIAHGTQKLFGWFGGHGITATATAFEKMGFRPGRVSAISAGLGEAGGGALLALGLATPAGGAAAAGTMAVAATVHAPAGFFAAGGGYEFPASLAVSTAALTLTGPGKWSVDSLLGNRFNRPWMAIAGLVGAAAAANAVVTRRRRELAASAPTPEAAAERA